MEQALKKPVDIVQELIAIHTTRIEASNRLESSIGAPTLNTLKNQSTHFISELMNELSNYGDAVTSATERDNEYQEIWTKSLSQLNSLSTNKSEGILNKMEENLKKIYSEILEDISALPEFALKIVSKQKMALSTLVKNG